MGPSTGVNVTACISVVIQGTTPHTASLLRAFDADTAAPQQGALHLSTRHAPHFLAGAPCLMVTNKIATLKPFAMGRSSTAAITASHLLESALLVATCVCSATRPRNVQ